MCEETTKEQVQGIMNFLMGKKLPEGWEMSHSPCLSHKKAFKIIYFLQEHAKIIPDTFEKCDICHEIFNTWNEGLVLTEDYKLKNGNKIPKKYYGFYCDDCRPDIEYVLE